MERVEILRDLKLGIFDVLVGINLLREGLDLPEVTLVAVLDADKEGFLRSERSLTQTAGRAARNSDGLVIFYADKITDSMHKTMSETERRRIIQMNYNQEHNITPTTVSKTKEQIMEQSSIVAVGRDLKQVYIPNEETSLAADPVLAYMSQEEINKQIEGVRKKMKAAAKELDFIEAARHRDEIFALEKLLKKKQ